MRNLIFIVLAIFSIQSGATKPSPVIGNPKAPVGGTLFQNLDSEPEVLNPISESEYVTQQVMNYVIEGLLTQNPETFEYEQGLADKWEVSKDFLSYTFHLRKDAVFSDGTPVTSDDVRFSFECVRNPAYKAVHRLPYYDNIEKIETPDASTIRFVMKKKYYLNMDVLGSGGFTPIVPKSVYGDPSKSLSKVMVGSGPYKIDKYEHGKSIELVRNDKWWGYKVKDPAFIAINKFDRTVFRFIKEQNLQLEMLKKKQFDYIEAQPEIFVQKAVGEPFGTDIIKHKEENQDATRKSFYFMALNFKNPIFQDRNVRLALAYLMDRPQINEKFRFGLNDLAAGPTFLRNQEIADPAVKPIPYDPKKGMELLKKAGWEDKEKTGILQKEINGKKIEFRFRLLLPNRDYEKYFTLFKEELKKAGIDLEIQNIEWNAFVKLLDDQKFDALAMSWVVGSPEADMKQIWHSTSAALGGSNFISYNNPEVDKLIDSAREEMNPTKRRTMWRKAYRLIAEDEPYVFMFSTRYDLYLVWKDIGQAKGTLKYDRGVGYWWKKQ